MLVKYVENLCECRGRMSVTTRAFVSPVPICQYVPNACLARLGVESKDGCAYTMNSPPVCALTKGA